MISVRFTCAACGLTDVIVECRDRSSPDQDVKWYVEQVIGRAVSDKHRRLAPWCAATKMTALKIPLCPDSDPDPWIGKQTDVIPARG